MDLLLEFLDLDPTWITKDVDVRCEKGETFSIFVLKSAHFSRNRSGNTMYKMHIERSTKVNEVVAGRSPPSLTPAELATSCRASDPHVNLGMPNRGMGQRFLSFE